MTNFQVAEITCTEEKSLAKLLEFFKMYKTSWKFKRKQKIRDDPMLAFVETK